MLVTTAHPPPQLSQAREVSRQLANLTGPEREEYIKRFREQNQGQIFVALHLHNHQPIYRPGVHPADTPEIRDYVLGGGDADNRREVYTSADAYAIEERLQQSELGFQVSYSGSLMDNLDQTAGRGLWPGPNWSDRYRNLRDNTATPLGNERLDLVNFGHYHPLMALVATGHREGATEHDKDSRLQIELHRQAVTDHFGGSFSKGFFPPEMAFSERMVPVVAATGSEWAIVDNLHFDRANKDYKNPQDGLKPPNRADQRHPGGQPYETLSNDLAKRHLVTPDALRPHYVKHVDPVSGDEHLLVAVPQDRSLSSYIQKDRNGARMQEVVDRFSVHNTDPQHPLLVVLASDGDNNGSNSGASHREVPLDLAERFPGQVKLITISDYLEIYPPERPREETVDGSRRFVGGDQRHVEDGSWWGANLGDPEFSKWIDDPAMTTFSPKNNSWAVLTAAKNEVLTADSLAPAGDSPESLRQIQHNSGSATERAWHGLLVGQTSCYEYWNADNVLSYSSVRGANMAVEAAREVTAGMNSGQDRVGPSVFLPRHTPYNPGGRPGRFQVQTYAYDVSGLASVKVRFRLDEDGELNRNEDFRFEGPGVTPWAGEVEMVGTPFPDLENKPGVWVDPLARADVFRGQVQISLPEGAPGALVQYCVEATDRAGNVTRSPLRNVWVDAQGTPLSNDELHRRLGSGEVDQVAEAIAYVLSTGRNDQHIFNHLFHRLETGGAALIERLEVRAREGELPLSSEPAFREEYINRLDRHLEKQANQSALRQTEALREALAGPLAGSDDPRVARILQRLGL